MAGGSDDAELGSSDPSAGEAAPRPGSVVRSRRRLAGVATALVLIVGVVVTAIILGSGGGDGHGDGHGDGTESAPPSTTGGPATASAARQEDEEITPQRAFPQASRRLEQAGTFTYQGTVHAAGTSNARPGPLLATDVTVEGEVALPDRTHDVATDASGRAAETVTSGLTVWARTADSRDRLAAGAYEAVAEFSSVDARASSGAALLPRLLSLTSDRRAGNPDPDGRRTFHATLAAEGLGTDETGRPTGPPGELTLTLDQAGDPTRIELVSPPGDGSALRLAFDIAAIGEPVTIDAPGGDEPTSVTGPVTVDEVLSAGIDRPVELAQVPHNWVLRAIELGANSPRVGCSTLKLSYQDVDAVNLEHFVDLSVSSAGCAAEREPYPEAIAAGAFSGTIDPYPDGTSAQLTDGRTAVDVFTDLSTDDLTRLLESLEPFDPTTPPQPIEGVPSS